MLSENTIGRSPFVPTKLAAVHSSDNEGTAALS
jgi:hypothetical protein